ncbi:hypothetical protein [Paraglaciecola sp. 25GB23A]|uniref:hypothetical protein n=1 Tax=Paraglaciecola sp. 25GB23A TaxID=3156068 RepID=UPI0032AF0C74
MSNDQGLTPKIVMYGLVLQRMAEIQIEAKDTGEFDGAEFAILFGLFGELAPPEDYFKVEAALYEQGLLISNNATFDA